MIDVLSKIEFGCSFQRNMTDVVCLDSCAVFVQILYAYFSSVSVDVLEQCLCICFGAYVCANVALWRMPFSL